MPKGLPFEISVLTAFQFLIETITFIFLLYIIYINIILKWKLNGPGLVHYSKMKNSMYSSSKNIIKKKLWNQQYQHKLKT